MTVTIHSYQDGKESVVSAAGSFTGYWMDETKPEKRTYSVEINIPYVYRFCDFHTVQSPSDAIVKEAGGHYLFGKVTACEEDVVFIRVIRAIRSQKDIHIHVSALLCGNSCTRGA